MDHVSKVKKLLINSKIAPVVGAGVSYATAGLPNWKGLIESGLQYAIELNTCEKKIQLVKEYLTKNNLLDAATELKKILNAPSHPFSNWLKSTLGEYQVTNMELIRSIQNLCQPIILTTNYDDLLRSTGSPLTNEALNWTQHEQILDRITNDREFIFHLHGEAVQPKTLIFGREDYEQLKHQTGYKTILTKLWLERSFLFIGCSKDGIMDDDFSTILNLMADWFPSQQQEHYVLMLNNEKGSNNHWELMQKCNVHPIFFGESYDDLPKFINSINTNVDKIADRLNQRAKSISENLKSIFEAQNSELTPEEINKRISELLGPAKYWSNNNGLDILSEALKIHNGKVKDKLATLYNYQLLTKSIVSISEINKKIDLWLKNWNNVSNLNAHEYIDSAIIAFKCLEDFPKDTLHDINDRQAGIIHSSYMNGYLTQFYNEALYYKSNPDQIANLKNDNYFFENLTRIFRSLEALLSVNPKTIYGERSAAKYTQDFISECLLFVEAEQITLREVNNPYKIIAELPWEFGLEFKNAYLTKYQGSYLVIGYNNKTCFKWNPQNESIPYIIHETSSGTSINDINVLLEGENVIIEIIASNNTRNIIVNFELKKEIVIEDKYKNHVRIDNTVFSTYSINNGMRTNCIFRSTENSEYEPLISTIDIWNLVKDIDIIHQYYTEFQNNEYIFKNKIDFLYPYISQVSIKKTAWIGSEVIAVLTRINFLKNDVWALLFFEPNEKFDIPIFKIVFPKKICFCFDTILNNNDVDLVVGYLDSGEIENLVQYFPQINQQTLIIATNSNGIITKERTDYRTQDILHIKYVAENKIFAIEENRILYEINPLKLNYNMKEIEGLRNIKYYNLNSE